MKNVHIGLLLILFCFPAYSQNEPAYKQYAVTYFNEIKAATLTHKKLWGKTIYGPILLVDPKTRQVYANIPGNASALTKDADIFTGTIPNNINIANTAIEWNQTRWAMVMLPLPEDKQSRIDLLAHELFHLQQPSLGFVSFNTDNNHLDQLNGRIYLRLELEALRKAIATNKRPEQKKHVMNALRFRRYRHSLYAGADSTENKLELNEGLAEYTGNCISGRTNDQIARHFEASITRFLKNPSFVRSFAYQTIPVYGYLLARQKKLWHQEIKQHTDLTDYFMQHFAGTANMVQLTDASIKNVVLEYNGQAIISAEHIREEKKQQQLQSFRKKFILDPHFKISFEKMSVSFDPRNIIPLDNKGTVYPSIRVTDNWGILTVENGALMSPNWNTISLSFPLSISPNLITGEGWKLELKTEYEIIKDDITGNYSLRQKRKN